MTGLRQAVEHEPAGRFKDQKQSQTGLPLNKIVYVGDLSGEASYGLRYAQQLAHERHAELVLVHSLDPIVYALPGASCSTRDRSWRRNDRQSDLRMGGKSPVHQWPAAGGDEQ